MKIKITMLLAAFATAFNGAFANSLIGISSDGNTASFPIEKVRSIKFNPQSDGDKGFQTLKFGEPTESGVGESNSFSVIAVYPNPVSSYISISGVSEEAVVSVVNMQGVEVLKSQGTNVNVSGLNAGAYVLIVEGEKVKFIKK